MAFEYKQTITKKLPHPLLTMAMFVKFLGVSGKINLKNMSDQDISDAVISFWDQQHGEG